MKSQTGKSLQRRGFLKYAGGAAIAVGASVLGLDYLLNTQPHTPNQVESSLTTLGNSTSISTASSTALFSVSGRLFFDKGTSQFGTAGDGIQSDPDMEPGEPNANRTIIEPAIEFGYQYLLATAYYSAKFKNIVPHYDAIPVPYALYNATLAVRQAQLDGRTSGLDAANNTLSKAEDAFQSGQYSDSQAFATQASRLASQATRPAITSTATTLEKPATNLFPAIIETEVAIGVAVAGIAVIVLSRRRKPHSTI